MDLAATRIFAAPDSIPPEDFAAYAILATRHRPGGTDRNRYLSICRAYLDVLDDALREDLPQRDRQLVTVWPVSQERLSSALNKAHSDADRCAAAVDHYHMPTGKRAMSEAERGSPELLRELSTRNGPFLLAWNPSSDKGQSGVPLFRMDLSEVRTQTQARALFRLWRRGVLENAENWVDGWHDPDTRLRLKLFIENNANDALQGLGQATELVKVWWSKE